MGLLSGLLGSSSKSSSTASAQTDNRRVLGDGSSSLEVSGQGKVNSGVLVDGYGNTSNVSSYSLSVMSDQGAMDTAARLAEAAGLVADRATSGALTLSAQSLGLASDALYANGRAMKDGLDFGHAALDIAGASMDRATAGAFGFGGAALTDALDFTRTSNAQAFSFGDTAVSAVGDAVTGALGFGRDALSGAFGAVETGQAGAYRLVDNTVGNAFGLVQSQAESSAANLRGIYETALDAIGVSNARLGDAYADSQGRGALTDKMLMLAIGGAMLIAAISISRN